MPNIDFQATLVEGGAGFLAGGGQRMAWEASETIGLIATGGTILGGLLLNAFTRQPLLHQVGSAAVISGAAVGGWVATEKFLIEGSEGRRIGHLPAQQRERALAAEARELAYSGRSSNGLAHNAMVSDDDITVL